MIIQIRPAGLAGLGCACGGACNSCKLGLGDTTTNPTTIFDSLWSGLTTVIPVGETGIPVWLIVAAGVLAAASLMPKPSEYRRR